MTTRTHEDFQRFMSQLLETNADLAFYTDFEKCRANVSTIAIKLNQLNYLIGKTDIEEAVRDLWAENSKVFEVLGILIATRDRDNKKVPHYFNYTFMKELNGGHQMTDVCRLPAIAPWEKSCTKHPTQKPLALLTRIIQASTTERAWILDPFAGSSTTGIAANLLNRRFLGIDSEEAFLEISKARKAEIEDPAKAKEYIRKIARVNEKERAAASTLSSPVVREEAASYDRELPF